MFKITRVHILEYVNVNVPVLMMKARIDYFWERERERERERESYLLTDRERLVPLLT